MHLIKDDENEAVCGMPVVGNDFTTDRRKVTCPYCLLLGLSEKEMDKLWWGVFEARKENM